jgi:hypothetical protein
VAEAARGRLTVMRAARLFRANGPAPRYQGD